MKESSNSALVHLYVALGLLAALVMLRLVADDAEAPPWVAASFGCRDQPTAHVHDPDRLELRHPCSTFSGRVTRVHFVAAYDDLKITLAPTAAMRSYLPAVNRGRLVADVIATDQTRVRAPEVGSVITVWGAWVHDKATKTAMLLPAYGIAVDDASRSAVRGHSNEQHGPSVARKLRIKLGTRPRVVVGGEIRVAVHAQWARAGRLTPASQIRLFAEMTGHGIGARWKALETDTQGMASLRMVAIQTPGNYQLTMYAAPSGVDVSARTAIKVADR